MRNVSAVIGSGLLLCLAGLVPLQFAQIAMFANQYIVPLLPLPLAVFGAVDLTWHAPNATWINNLSSVMNSTGTNGFVFSSSELPTGVKYGTYNWCNMPHVRKQEYPKAGSDYVLKYVEVVRFGRTVYSSWRLNSANSQKLTALTIDSPPPQTHSICMYVQDIYLQLILTLFLSPIGS